ncbi:MAG: flagellar biosynthetic protein FliR [Armatimonadota bacterium]
MDAVLVAIPVFARTAGVLTTAPGFGLRAVPLRIRLAAAVVLTPAMMPNAVGSVPAAAEPWALVPASIEQLAVAASLFFYGVGIAGQILDRQLAFIGGGRAAPASGGQMGHLGAFYFAFATLVFFITDGHHALLGGLARSWAALPLGEGLPAGASAGQFCGLVGTLFVAALEVGAPVVAAVFIADVAIAVLARVAPGLQPLAVGLPARSLVGLFAVVLSLPLVVSAVERYCGNVGQAISMLLQAG